MNLEIENEASSGKNFILLFLDLFLHAELSFGNILDFGSSVHLTIYGQIACIVHHFL